MLVYDVEIGHHCVKIGFEIVEILHLLGIISEETFEIRPHLGHILTELESSLVLVLDEVVFYRDQIHEFKPWLLLDLHQDGIVNAWRFHQVRSCWVTL